MSNSSNLAQTSAKSGFNVLWGLIFSSIISAVGTIIVGNTLGDEQYGLIAIALSGPTILTSIRDLGVNSALIKFSAQYRTEKNTEKLKNIIIVGVSFEIILGIVFTIASFLLSGVMANLLGRPTLVPLIQIASVTILTGGLLKAAQSVFIGYERMELNSLTVLIHSLLKTSLMIVLVSLNYGTYGAIIGQIFGYSSAALVSLALLYLTVIAKLRKQKGQFHIVSTIKTVLTFGLPLSVDPILTGILSQFYIFLTAIYVSDQLMSNYSMALQFATLVGVFASSVITVMLPTFSKISGKDDTKTLQSVFQYSIKYTSLLILPLTFAVITLSKPGVEVLFQNNYEFTPMYLSLYCLFYVYSAIGSLSTGSLISGQGKTQVNMKIALLNFICGVSLGFLLIPSFEIFGLIVSYLLSVLPGMILSLVWIKKHYNATVDWVSSIKILAVSVFSSVFTHVVINQLNLTDWVGLILGAAIFLGTYVISASVSGAISYPDTQILKDAIKSLGPLAVIINSLLYPIEKIAKCKHKAKSK